MSTTNYKELTTADIAKRLNEFRRTILAIVNQDTLNLLEEVERRLDGGVRLSAIDQMSKKEKGLRDAYEHYKSWSTDKSRYNYFYGRPIQPYEVWKVEHLKYERERIASTRSENRHKNEVFQYRVKRYLEINKQIPKGEDISLQMTEVAFDRSGHDIEVLRKNKTSLDILKNVLEISNLNNPTKLDGVKYWHVTRDEYERKKKLKTNKK